MVLNDLKAIYQSDNRQTAIEATQAFIVKYQVLYPKVVRILQENPSHCSYYDFPVSIQRSLYTTNLIESLNKQLKRYTKKKEQFPNEASLERFVCSLFIEWNHKYLDRIHKGFALSVNELNMLFENQIHDEI